VERYPLTIEPVPPSQALTGLLPSDSLPEGTRGRILLAAVQLFASKGFAGTSIRDIAPAAGVQTATLYGHFASKDEMLEELVRIGYEEHLKTIRAAVLAAPSDPRDQLAALIRAQVLFHVDYRLAAVVINNELPKLNPERMARVGVLGSETIRLRAEILERGVAQGVFSVEDADLAAIAIGSMCIRVAYWYSHGEAPDPEVLADTYARFALRLVGCDA
jgi:AcrR family transcriptional regulator